MNWKEKLKSLQGVQARIVSSVVGGKVRTNISLIISIEYLEDILLIFLKYWYQNRIFSLEK